MGRTAKPAPKAARAKMKAAASLTPTKKTLAMTALSEAKTKKSYHSKVVPAADAATIRRMAWVLGAMSAMAAELSVVVLVMNGPALGGI